MKITDPFRLPQERSEKRFLKVKKKKKVTVHNKNVPRQNEQGTLIVFYRFRIE